MGQNQTQLTDEYFQKYEEIKLSAEEAIKQAKNEES